MRSSIYFLIILVILAQDASACTYMYPDETYMIGVSTTKDPSKVIVKIVDPTNDEDSLSRIDIGTGILEMVDEAQVEYEYVAFSPTEFPYESEVINITELHYWVLSDDESQIANITLDGYIIGQYGYTKLEFASIKYNFLFLLFQSETGIMIVKYSINENTYTIKSIYEIFEYPNAPFNLEYPVEVYDEYNLMYQESIYGSACEKGNYYTFDAESIDFIFTESWIGIESSTVDPRVKSVITIFSYSNTIKVLNYSTNEINSFEFTEEDFKNATDKNTPLDPVFFIGLISLVFIRKKKTFLIL